MNEETIQGRDPITPGTLSEAPAMSVGATLLGVFLKPRPTLQALAARPRVLAPILLVIFVVLGLTFIQAQSGLLKSDMLAKMEAQNAPPERIEMMSKAMDGPPRYFIAFGNAFIGLPIMLFGSAAILYFMANLMLGARLRYLHYLSIVAYSNVVALLDHIAQLAIGLTRGTLLVPMGIGAFMGDELSKPMRAVDVATDPLFLWSATITALGVAIMARKSFGFGVVAVLPLFVIRVVLYGFLA